MVHIIGRANGFCPAVPLLLGMTVKTDPADDDYSSFSAVKKLVCGKSRSQIKSMFLSISSFRIHSLLGVSEETSIKIFCSFLQCFDQLRMTLHRFSMYRSRPV